MQSLAAGKGKPLATKITGWGLPGCGAALLKRTWGSWQMGSWA